MERRIGVYICHCGLNIAATLDPLDIADAGFKVYLVEREPSIGGLSLHNSISPFVAKKKISMLQRTSNLNTLLNPCKGPPEAAFNSASNILSNYEKNTYRIFPSISFLV